MAYPYPSAPAALLMQAQYAQPLPLQPMAGYRVQNAQQWRPVSSIAPNIMLPVAAMPYARPYVDTFSRANATPPIAVNPELSTEPPTTALPVAPLSTKQKGFMLANKALMAQWRAKLGSEAALSMMVQVNDMLDKKGKLKLQNLLQSGKLTSTDGDNQSDNGLTTLHYLYRIAMAPRAQGLQSKAILNEVVSCLDNPYSISQQFDALKPQIAQAMTQLDAPVDPRKSASEDFADFSNTCSASGVMFILAQQQPKELARMAEGLTSPRLATTEIARLDQLANTPFEAYQKLKQNAIPYEPIDANTVRVTLRVPKSAYLRTLNDEQVPGKRNGTEAALQSAFIHLVSRNSYNGRSDKTFDFDTAKVAIENTTSLSPALKTQLTALVDSGLPFRQLQQQFLARVQSMPTISPEDRQTLTDGIFAEASGINEDQISLLRSIIEDKTAVDSVTYMVTDANPDPQQAKTDTSPYLYGYKRSFEQIAQDLVTALKNGHYMIIGTVPTNAQGRIENGHIRTLTGAFLDAQGEVQFTIADSDDGIPRHSIESARKLIPELHHVSFPKEQALQIKQEMQQLGANYYVPGKPESAQYNLVAMAHALNTNQYAPAPAMQP
ncbi:MAG: hypothetical protein VKJ06_04110 [Vampirovibrionales bacterium]|nr:hypothetical protein [Vampirovibrionales bacterium]